MPFSELNELGKEYGKQWRTHFATRIHAAALFSQIAMRPWSRAVMIQLIKSCPRILTYGAKLSGKIQQVVRRNMTDIIDKDN